MARLDKNKWFVENITDKTDVKIEATPNQGVFVSKIKNTVVTIVGKSNTIVIENAEASGVIFDDVISTVEVINSKKLQLQANGSVHAISIDKSAGVTVFLQSAR
jgi:adenylyl cyclase-associated protein